MKAKWVDPAAVQASGAAGDGSRLAAGRLGTELGEADLPRLGVLALARPDDSRGIRRRRSSVGRTTRTYDPVRKTAAQSPAMRSRRSMRFDVAADIAQVPQIARPAADAEVAVSLNVVSVQPPDSRRLVVPHASVHVASKEVHMAEPMTDRSSGPQVFGGRAGTDGPRVRWRAVAACDRGARGGSMRSLPPTARVFIATAPCDLRKQLDGIAVLVEQGAARIRAVATGSWCSNALATDRR